MAKYETLMQRIVANIHEPENEQACWRWKGNTDTKGYARLTLRLPGRKNPTGMRVARVVEGIFRAREADSDDLFHEFHPDDETIEHLCATTCCVNPDHWVLLTRSENTRRMLLERRYA